LYNPGFSCKQLLEEEVLVEEFRKCWSLWRFWYMIVLSGTEYDRFDRFRDGERVGDEDFRQGEEDRGDGSRWAFSSLDEDIA